MTVHDNRRLVWRLLLVVIAMFGFGYALVPLYGLMCDAFGINGRFQDIEQGQYDVQQGRQHGQQLAMRKDLQRTVTVQFFTNLGASMEWDFKPMTRQIKVHPGEITVVKFYAKNRTGRKVVAQAIPSLVPGQAVKYFIKMECFCFSQQTFDKGEAREMPLQFVVDPDLPKRINTITLAYTFFDTDQKSTQHNVASNTIATPH